MRVFARLALACALAGGPAHARPFTVEDLLSLEGLGRVNVSPDERWLVIERFGGWKTAPNFDHEFLNPQTTGRLWVVDLRDSGPPRPLLAPAAGAGDTLGVFSPDGSKVIVYRLRDHRRELGVVTLATGAVRWSGLTVEPEVWSVQARWRDNDQVVAITRPPEGGSLLLGAGWQTQSRTTAAWSAMSQGLYSGVAWGSGRYERLNPPPPAADLVAFDTATGQLRPLARGAFAELSLAPGGRTAALAEETDLVTPKPEEAVRTGSSPRRRRLVLVDLDDGAVARPCPACDLARYLWAWSPDGRDLIAAARTGGQSWSAYRYWRFSADGVARPLVGDLALGDARSPSGVEVSLLGDAAWLGKDPVVLGRPADGSRLDWWRIGARGPVKLTGRLDAPLGRAALRDRSGLTIRTTGGLYRLTPDGPPRRLGPADARVQPGPTALGEPAVAALVTEGGQGEVLAADGRSSAGPRLAADEALVALAPRTGLAVVTRRDPRGVLTLTLRRSGTGPESPPPLVTVNADLETIDTAQPIAIRHTGPRGEPLTSWLYLPAGHAPGDARPLIIAPYPGSAYPQPPADRAPGVLRLDSNVQVMVGAGYAVLVPSLPIPMDQEPAPGLAEAILRVVAAARAQQPGLSDRPPALWGQSFGGWGVLMAASQSPGFSAVVASAPITDFVAMHGGQRLNALSAPEVALNVPGMQAYTENGQARMGAAPWAALDKYVRNSPRYQTDKITAPVMLIYGDLDFDPIQVEAVFTSLHRQGKDAQLIVYRGEQHVITSPANVRDLYGRALAFLAETLGPPPISGSAAPAMRPSQ